MSATPVRILVVDDEPPIRKLLRLGLNARGYDVHEAVSGKTGLDMLATKPDLVILDLGLADIDGLTLLEAIRQRCDSLPIIVLSSRGDEAGKVAALDLGADDYVTKPFGMDELLARMRAAVRHQLQVHGERPIFRVGDLSVDLVRRIVKRGEQRIVERLDEHVVDEILHRFSAAPVGERDRRHMDLVARPAGYDSRDRHSARASATASAFCRCTPPY